MFGKIITKFALNYVNIINFNIVAYATVRHSKTCTTHKCDFRINWKFGNKLILPVSTKVVRKLAY